MFFTRFYEQSIKNSLDIIGSKEMLALSPPDNQHSNEPTRNDTPTLRREPAKDISEKSDKYRVQGSV